MAVDLGKFLHNVLDQLDNTSSVDVFYHQFEAIRSLVSSAQPWLPEAYFATRFVYGLREEIQGYVMSFQPVTVIDAFHLACIYEYTFCPKYYFESRQMNCEETIQFAPILDPCISDMGWDIINFLYNALDDLQQISSLDEYYHQFQAIRSLITSIDPGIPESYFTDRFIYGLCQEIQPYVIQIHPFRIIDAYHLAAVYQYSRLPTDRSYVVLDTFMVDAESQVRSCNGEKSQTVPTMPLENVVEVVDEEPSSKISTHENTDLELVSDAHCRENHDGFMPRGRVELDEVQMQNSEYLTLQVSQEAYGNDDVLEEVSSLLGTIIMVSASLDFVAKIEVPIAWSLHSAVLKSAGALGSYTATIGAITMSSRLIVDVCKWSRQNLLDYLDRWHLSLVVHHQCPSSTLAFFHKELGCHSLIVRHCFFNWEPGPFLVMLERSDSIRHELVQTDMEEFLSMVKQSGGVRKLHLGVAKIFSAFAKGVTRQLEISGSERSHAADVNVTQQEDNIDPDIAKLAVVHEVIVVNYTQLSDVSCVEDIWILDIGLRHSTLKHNRVSLKRDCLVFTMHSIHYLEAQELPVRNFQHLTFTWEQDTAQWEMVVSSPKHYIDMSSVDNRIYNFISELHLSPTEICLIWKFNCACQSNKLSQHHLSAMFMVIKPWTSNGDFLGFDSVRQNVMLGSPHIWVVAKKWLDINGVTLVGLVIQGDFFRMSCDGKSRQFLGIVFWDELQTPIFLPNEKFALQSGWAAALCLATNGYIVLYSPRASPELYRDNSAYVNTESSLLYWISINAQLSNSRFVVLYPYIICFDPCIYSIWPSAGKFLCMLCYFNISGNTHDKSEMRLALLAQPIQRESCRIGLSMVQTATVYECANTSAMVESVQMPTLSPGLFLIIEESSKRVFVGIDVMVGSFLWSSYQMSFPFVFDPGGAVMFFIGVW